MNAFCDRQGKSLSQVRFLFDGQRVQPTDTPGAGGGAPAGGGDPAAPEHLNIKVTDNNNEVFFKIKRSTKLEKP